MAWKSESFFFEFQKIEGEGRDSTTKAANVEKKKKRSLFIYLLRKKGWQIYITLTIRNAKGVTIENDDEKKIEMVIEAFKDYCKPMKTLIVDVVEFIGKEQSKDESFEDYLLNLKSSSKDFEWNNVTENDMIKLQIIKGIHDKKTREINLREPDLTLTQCIDRCRATEQSKIHSQKIEKYEKLNVDDDAYEKDINATGRKKKTIWLHLYSEKPCKRNKKLYSLWPGMF